MPPRQPLKLKTPTARRTGAKKPNAPDLELTSPPAAAPSRPQPRSAGFSPYPDLTMAIEMLKKRANNLSEGERRQLVAKWAETLQKMQTEMQKLHKLEILANRLITNPAAAPAPTRK